MLSFSNITNDKFYKCRFFSINSELCKRVNYEQGRQVC